MIDSIGKYRILELIGRGGMGAVYKALDPVLKRVVAIKVIADTAAVTDALRARFFREARAAANLSHRNIVTVYDLGEDHEQLFLVMEYLDGEELKGVTAADGDLSVETKLTLMIQVCEALAYAHAKGVVHRDIKPANIFVLSDRTVKILDFGLARITTATDSLTETGHIMGTARYMAPEQVSGRVDRRSDMFSAGVVFYELLTSRSPLHGNDLLSILDELGSKASPSLFRPDPVIHEDLAVVVERMLQKDPDARYADMADVRNALEGVRVRLRAEAAGLRRSLEDLSTTLRELDATVSECLGFTLAPLTPSWPGEGTSVVALQRLQREYQARVARLEQLQERAGAVRVEYEQAMEQLDAGEWEAALAGFERVVREVPEHSGAQEGLERARAVASEEAARYDREAAETACLAMEEARGRAEATGTVDASIWSEAEAVRAAASTAFAEQRYGAARTEFAVAAERYLEAAASAGQREESRLDGERLAGLTPDGSPREATNSNDVESTVVALPLPPSTRGPGPTIDGAPDSMPRETAATRLSDAIVPEGHAVPVGQSIPRTAIDPDGLAAGSAAQRSEAGPSGIAATAPVRMAPSSPPALPRVRTLALGSLAVAIVIAVIWLVSSLATSRRLQAEATQARQRVDASREEAVQFEAPLLARTLFDAAVTKDREGQQLAGARRFGPAMASLSEAARIYTDATKAAKAAREVRDQADRARAEMLAAKKNAVPEATEFPEALAREQEGDDRYKQLAFAEAVDRFDAAARLYARALPPPVTAPAPPVETDSQDEIREVLRQYSRAFETKDLALLQQVRPALPAAELARYRATFDQVRSYRLALQVDSVTVKGDEAEAKGHREDVIVTGNGETVRYPGEFRFRLKRMNDRWTIAAVK
ncbi:MAG TPA: protein kinase [Candidatus Methylomirabilis sp.]|nr:protein kinase [Candidatus Methylomirabilis sp.]